MTTAAPSPPAPRHPWALLFGLLLGVTVTNGFARFAYGLLLPAMRSDLGWTWAQAGWLNTANALGYLAGAVATMLLIGRVGPGRLFAAGLVLTTVALALTGLSADLGWQTALRALAGLFGAMSFATAGALAAQLFPGDPRRTALAIALLFGMGGGLGIVLAGVTLPPLLEWRGPASWPLGWYVIGTLSCASLPWGLWSARRLRGDGQPVRPAPLPVRAILPELAGYAGFGLGYFVYLTFIAGWMRAIGLPGTTVALVWMAMGLALVVSPFLWRGLFARYEGGLPLALVLTCIAAGTALPLILPPGPWLVLSALVFGLSVFMAPGAITAFARHNLPPESVGAGVSLFTVVFATAQIIGPWAAGHLGDLTGDIGDSLIAAALVLLLGALCAATQRPLRTIRRGRDDGAEA